MSMTAPQRRTPRRSRSARPTLVEQAALLFGRHGYRGTTPDLLAEAAGVPVVDLPARSDLFAQVLERVRSALIEGWAAETDVPEDPESRLRLASRLFVQVSASHSAEFAAAQRALGEGPEEEIAGALQGLVDEALTWLAALMRQGQQSGLVRRSLDPTLGAWHLLYTGLGLLAAAPLNHAARTRLDYLSPAIDCALHGILKTDV